MPFPHSKSQIKSGAQAVESGRKGGLVSSPKKKFAARLRELKKKPISKIKNSDIFDMLLYPEISALDSLFLIYQLEKKAKTFNQKVKVVRLMLEWHKIWHGNMRRVPAKPEDYNFKINVICPNQKTNNK